MSTNKRIYLDYQSAKPVDPQVVGAMIPYFNEKFGNPSSLHGTGDEATDALEKSREMVAQFIKSSPNEIIFTSGATESNNLALLGFTERNKRKGKHVIISEIEHISIHNLAKVLTRQGYDVSKVPVDQFGRVKINKLKSRIREDTILISIQFANNEIGTIQPIKEISEIAHENEIALHTDAIAAEGQLNIDVGEYGIDLMSLSSNDIYGPKGIGALYVNKKYRIVPQIIGGGQERGLRSGSENMPNIIGFSKAAEIMMKTIDNETKRLSSYQKILISEILNSVDDSYLNGHPQKRIPNNTHVRFDGIEGESILLSYKDKGIDISTGSACTSKTLEPSHTLIATGLLHEEAHGSLQITTGRFTTKSDIDRIIDVTPEIVQKLRKLSPLYEIKQKNK